MKAPEKIYLTKNLLGELRDGWDALPSNDFINIEYVRKDVFIEKAEGWLREFQKGFILTDKDITDFVNYMKEK